MRTLRHKVDIEVQEPNSPHKKHVFRVYSDGHIVYNQKICGTLFYRSFTKANKHHGYYDRLMSVTKCPTKYVRYINYINSLEGKECA